jgi:hypothetical protein
VRDFFENVKNCICGIVYEIKSARRGLKMRIKEFTPGANPTIFEFTVVG